MKYTILVIDDDEPIHYLVENLLGTEFDLIHTKDAQGAIDVLAKKGVNLILSDIHMPGLSGLELLEALRNDPDKRDIPVLIMTNLPSVEKEQRAMALGASDFLKKELFHKDPQHIVNVVRMKLVTRVEVKGLSRDLVQSKNRLVMALMDSAISGAFSDTVDVLCDELAAILDSEYLGFWLIKEGKPVHVKSLGHSSPGKEEKDSIEGSGAFANFKKRAKPYLSNNIFADTDHTFFQAFSSEKELSAEISVPMFSVSEQALLNNDMKVPGEADLFGCVIIKRNVLFSSEEFMLVSKLITQAGSIVWRLSRS